MGLKGIWVFSRASPKRPPWPGTEEIDRCGEVAVMGRWGCYVTFSREYNMSVFVLSSCLLCPVIMVILLYLICTQKAWIMSWIKRLTWKNEQSLATFATFILDYLCASVSVASVIFKMASKVFIEEADKNFDFITENTVPISWIWRF